MSNQFIWSEQDETKKNGKATEFEKHYILKNRNTGKLLGRVRYRDNSESYCAEIQDSSGWQYVSAGRNLLEQAKKDLENYWLNRV